MEWLNLNRAICRIHWNLLWEKTGFMLKLVFHKPRKFRVIRELGKFILQENITDKAMEEALNITNCKEQATTFSISK